MINFDVVIKENIKYHNPNWHRLLITVGSRSGKTNSLFSSISLFTQYSIIQNKNYFYDKDPYEAKCHFLITKQEKNRLKAF